MVAVEFSGPEFCHLNIRTHYQLINNKRPVGLLIVLKKYFWTSSYGKIMLEEFLSVLWRLWGPLLRFTFVTDYPRFVRARYNCPSHMPRIPYLLCDALDNVA